MDNLASQIIKKIKQKKEFQDLDNSTVSHSLSQYLQKHNIPLKDLSPKQRKLVTKEIRSQLRKLTGQYQKSSKKRVQFLDQNKIQELLKTHSSTAERLSFYPKLKKIISSLQIKSILDLACGLNPLALATKEITYHASDIKQSELDLIKTYFKKHNIRGTTFSLDIRLIEKAALPKTDLCLLFKVLDIIEDKGHKLAEKIIQSVPAKYILISFPTKKLSGKPMANKRRLWLERLLEHKSLKYAAFSSDNEVFYLAKKTSQQTASPQ